LFLHGGPGFPGIAVGSAYQKRLEDDFIIIQWDQRSAGKTYTGSQPRQRLTISLFLSDLFQLLDYIADKFGRKKVYLIGHSWGSLIGMLAVKQVPHRFISYIGVGQFVNLRQNSELCYQYCLQKAVESNNDKLVDAIKNLGIANDCAKWDLEHQYVALLGGSLYNRTDLTPVAELFFSTELYTTDEKQNIPQAMIDSSVALYDEMSKRDLIVEAKSVDVPILFLSGKHDCLSVTALVQKYYDVLHAPQKKILLFDKSAHFPFIEEPDSFCEAVCKWFA
jgi:pimeloyl-ACP methyl ester carboxylesterase